MEVSKNTVINFRLTIELYFFMAISKQLEMSIVDSIEQEIFSLNTFR